MSYEAIRGRLLAALDTVAEPDATISERVSTVAALISRADDCSEQVVNDGLMLRGSAGQMVSHPLISEERALRTQADRIWTECLPLNAPETDTEPVTDDVVSLKARRAAEARWNRHRAAGEIS